jgi:hypothetical protein
MSNVLEARKALVARILEGAGHGSPPQRRAAFDNAGLELPLQAALRAMVRELFAYTLSIACTYAGLSGSRRRIFPVASWSAAAMAGAASAFAASEPPP